MRSGANLPFAAPPPCLFAVMVARPKIVYNIVSNIIITIEDFTPPIAVVPGKAGLPRTSWLENP
jgi:hypothetical protein